MTKVEAITEMILNREKIRHSKWPVYQYVYYDFEYNLFLLVKPDNINLIDINDLLDHDLPLEYKIHKEPVTKYRWVFSVNDNLIISPEYYSNEKELRANIVSKFKWCERIESTAKEFYND